MTLDPCDLLLERVARANEPAPSVVERVVERVLAGERDAVTATLLQVLPLPPEVATDRFAVLEPRARPRLVLRHLALGVALLVVLMAVVIGVRARRSGPGTLDARLESEVARTFEEIPKVDVTYVGRGDVSGTQRNPMVFWEVGRLTMCVTPRRGIHVVVETPDGRVVVHGTCFQVVRDALGTRVTVTEGQVEVTCGEGASVLVDVGQGHDCRPTRPAALLARARALRDRGDNTGSLSTLDDALVRSAAGDPARGEILALQFDIQVARDDLPAALEAARTYLAEGYEPRAVDMSEIATRLHQRLGDKPAGQP